LFSTPLDISREAEEKKNTIFNLRNGCAKRMKRSKEKSPFVSVHTYTTLPSHKLKVLGKEKLKVNF